MVWDSILKPQHITHLRSLVTSLCPSPQRLFKDFNKVAFIALCLIKSAWITPWPELYYKHSSFDFSSSHDFFFLTLLLSNCHFPHCLWLAGLSFWQTNKQEENWRSSWWIWIKKTKSHNQHSDVALDDLSLQFFLEILSAICNTLCHNFFFFFCFIFPPVCLRAT